VIPDSAAARRPLVSVGLPVYNGERYLRRALDALVAQESVELEIIVADNASTDRSAEIAEARAAVDRRVRVLRSDANRGVEANFARVLDAASGTYFMWAGCDDWWAPTFVRRMIGALEADPAAVVAMSAVERVTESGLVVDVVRHTGAADPSRLGPFALTMQLAGGRPYHLFIYGLFRTAFLRQAFTGFAPVVGADRLFMCRVAMAGGFVYVDAVLHRRLVRNAPIQTRYADEAIGDLWRGSSARWRLAARAGPYLWRSPVLPRSRRPWIPAIVLRFAKASLGHALVQAGWLRARAAAAPPPC
jgi:glycosyltransferase involved in cell wall biosynthesis